MAGQQIKLFLVDDTPGRTGEARPSARPASSQEKRLPPMIIFC